MERNRRPQGRDLDRDPDTGQPEEHLGGLAGGAYAGGTTGKALAERINPAHEDEYWRHEFPSRPYAVASPHGWDDFGPAYRYGYERYPDFDGRRFEEVEPEFARDWEQSRGDSNLGWDEARLAARDAFERIAVNFERAVPGDADRDGR